MENSEKVKIIAVGDPHFQTDNTPEVNLFIERFLELLNKEKPDFVVILGDLLHTHERLHTVPLNKAYQFIKKVKDICYTFILVGNHDMTNNQQFLTENHWMNGLKEWSNVEIVDKVVKKTFKNKTFVLAPYIPTGRFIEGLDSLGKEEWINCDLIFCHQEFYGCKMGAIVSVEGDKWNDSLPQIISGHIHSKQNIGSNIYYCGSSLQHAFGESDSNIIPVIELETGVKKYKLKEVDLELPRKKIIYMDTENILDYKNEKKEGCDKVKITLQGDYEEFKALKKTKKYQDIIKSGTKIVFKIKKNKGELEEKLTQLVQKEEYSDFTKILNILIQKEKNEYLHELYELVVNNRVISEKDIIFL